MKSLLCISLALVLLVPAGAGAQIKSVTNAGGGTVVEVESLKDLDAKPSDLETVVAKLTNDVERLSYKVDLLEKKLARLNADYDVRFKMLENVRSAVTVEKPKGKSAAKSDAQATYDVAFAKIQKNDYAGAEKAFTAFIKEYPDSKLAGNAYYWLGESFYARKDFAKAAVAFAEGYQKHPKNSKAEDNFFKLGLSMKGMGRMDEACTVFGSFASEYPNASVKVKEKAQKEVSKLKCK